MMAYRKRRGYKSRVVKMKFQSFFDISTSDQSMQIISVNAGGIDVLKRLAPFFQAYKYYKLGGVSFKLIPASTLPVDPTGLSYQAGENTVDPRDQLTPGMCRITNGEDILENISSLSAEEQHKLYNNMLLDSRWYKWMLQSGVKRFGKPKYWQIGQLHQDKWPGAVTNMPQFLENSGVEYISGTTNEQSYRIANGLVKSRLEAGSSPYGIFQTGHRGNLSWLPTDAMQKLWYPSEEAYRNQAFLASVPEIELFKILMPIAYKTKYYYRAFITETVYFKDPVVYNINDYRPLDVFKVNPIPTPYTPIQNFPIQTDAILDQRTGGNDGSD